MLFGVFSQIKVRGNAGVRSENGREYLLEEEQRGESEVRAMASKHHGMAGLETVGPHTRCAGLATNPA
jgi:hypothetical protein